MNKNIIKFVMVVLGLCFTGAMAMRTNEINIQNQNDNDQEARYFFCEKCCTIFKDKEKFQNHNCQPPKVYSAEQSVGSADTQFTKNDKSKCFKCFCGKSFSLKQNLLRHVRECHENISRSYKGIKKSRKEHNAPMGIKSNLIVFHPFIQQQIIMPPQTQQQSLVQPNQGAMQVQNVNPQYPSIPLPSFNALLQNLDNNQTNQSQNILPSLQELLENIFKDENDK